MHLLPRGDGILLNEFALQQGNSKQPEAPERLKRLENKEDVRVVAGSNGDVSVVEDCADCK